VRRSLGPVLIALGAACGVQSTPVRQAEVESPVISDDLFERAVWAVVLSEPAPELAQTVKAFASVARLGSLLADDLQGSRRRDADSELQQVVDGFTRARHGDARVARLRGDLALVLAIDPSALTAFGESQREELGRVTEKLLASFSNNDRARKLRATFYAIEGTHCLGERVPPEAYDTHLLACLDFFARCPLLELCRTERDRARAEYQRRFCSTANVEPSLHVRYGYRAAGPGTETHPSPLVSSDILYLSKTDLLTQLDVARISEAGPAQVVLRMSGRAHARVDGMMPEQRGRLGMFILFRGDDVLGTAKDWYDADRRDRTLEDTIPFFFVTLKQVCLSIDQPNLPSDL
jgi:hypothetical protein